MPSAEVLIFVALVGAVLFARARVASGAIVFALFALVLFIGTPAGAGLPAMVSGFLGAISEASQPLTGGSKAVE